MSAAISGTPLDVFAPAPDIAALVRATFARYFASANSVGVFPVTCRNACENAGKLA
jgi:hypothetical protein